MNPDELRFWDMIVLAYVAGPVRSPPNAKLLAAAAAGFADAMIAERRTRVQNVKEN